MLFKILKKDLLKNKGTNLLIFSLILISMLLFAASSTVVLANTNSMSRYLENANLADYIIMSYEDGNDNVSNYLEDSEYVTKYDVEEIVSIPVSDFQSNNSSKITSDLIVSKVPEKYNFCYSMSNERFIVNDGEIYLPGNIKDKCNLNVGDKVTITVKENCKEFTIKDFTKDSCFGSDFMSVKRLFISDADFKALTNDGALVNLYFYSLNYDHTIDFGMKFNAQGFRVYTSLDRSLLEMAYFFDLLSSLIISVISMLLMLIAIVSLVFTIKFTLNKETTNIGILKAIGVKNSQVRSIYVSKYAFLTLIAVVLGFFIGIPISKALLDGISKTTIIEASFVHYLLSFIITSCAGLVIVLFAFIATHKVCKVKPITAIRGEDSIKTSRIKLSLKNSYSIISLKMAVIDLLKNMRRSLLLLLVFVISMLTVVVPANVITTLESDNVRTMFGYADFDFIVTPVNDSIDSFGKLNEYLENYSKTFKDNNKDVKFYAEVCYTLPVQANDENVALSVFSKNIIGAKTDIYEYIDGVAPHYANEVALGTIAMKKLGVVIGDSVKVTINGVKQEFIITGRYDSLMDMGVVLRFGDEFESPVVFDKLDVMGDIKDDTTIDEVKSLLERSTVKSTAETLNVMIGSMRNSLGLIRNGVLILITIIVFVVVMLISKLMLDKDYKDYALQKSLGVSNKCLYLFNLFRLSILSIAAVIITDCSSFIITKLISDGLFAKMGAETPMYYINGLNSYFIYPMVVMISILLGSITTFRSIKNIKAIAVRE